MMSTCIIDGCAGKHEAKGWCSTHYRRYLRHGDPLKRMNAGGGVSYNAAHVRCRRLWGPASQYPCVHCGGNACDWAYDHSDPSELTGLPSAGAASLAVYSAWPEFYMPLCKTCHATFDQSSPLGPPVDRPRDTRPRWWTPMA